MKRRYCDLDGQELKLLPLRQRKLVRQPHVSSGYIVAHTKEEEDTSPKQLAHIHQELHLN